MEEAKTGTQAGMQELRHKEHRQTQLTGVLPQLAQPDRSYNLETPTQEQHHHQYASQSLDKKMLTQPTGQSEGGIFSL